MTRGFPAALLACAFLALPLCAQTTTAQNTTSPPVIPFPDLDMMDEQLPSTTTTPTPAPAPPPPATTMPSTPASTPPQPVTPQPTTGFVPAGQATVPQPAPAIAPAAPQQATPSQPAPPTPQPAAQVAPPTPASATQPAALPATVPPAPAQPAPQPRATSGGLNSFEQRYSYAVGMKVGLEVRESLDKLPCKLDIPLFLQAIGDCLRNNPTAMTPEAAAKMLMDDLAMKNKREGDAFLAANAQREGVRTTPSGLQYKVLRAGSGPQPGPTDKVRINYVGALLDGTEFDSTKQRGPATYSMAGDNALLDGVAEGVRLMSTGAVYQFFLPPHLGFGEQGAVRVIGPNATLIFEIELLEIVP